MMQRILPSQRDNMGQWPEQAMPSKFSGQLREATLIANSNALLSASAAILAIIVQLQRYQFKLKPMALRNMLINELAAFEQALNAKQIKPASIVKAKYLVCAMLDEVVLTQYMTDEASGIWSQHGLVSTYFQDAWGGEQFFNILQEALLQPQDNLELLELILLFLQLGFAGKYRSHEQGNEKLINVRERVLHCVRSLKSTMGHKPIAIIKPNTVCKQHDDLLTPGFIALITFIILATTFICFSVQLSNIAEPVLQALQIGVS